VLRFGLKMCGDPEDAKDVLQETLLAASRGVQSFRGDAAFSTWLYTIARSFCLKQRRRSKFAPSDDALVSDDGAHETRAIEDPAHTPEQAASQRELGTALEDAIGALNAPYRDVLLLRDVEGLSAPEVADVLGTSVDAVKSRLHRARLFVRQRLEPLIGTPPDPATTTCPDVLQTLSEHEEGDISAEVCADMERHLDGCPHCRGACETLKRTLALCRTAPAAEVPEDVQQAVRAALRAVRASR
jgi:RNA polymerase sigma-70 factor (ECF subfamily)